MRDDMRYRKLLLAALTVLCALVTLPPPDVTAQSDRLRVVATFSILADIVQNVGGDRVAVRALVGPDGDTHLYEPTPADARALADAAVVFENGAGFEIWLDDLYRSARSRAKRVVMADAVPLLRTGDAGHHHGEHDPHIWHDVTNAVTMTYAIRDALVQADPANSDTYYQNAATYAASLAELDAWVFEQVATLPAERRKLVTSHNTFAYFARRYGFDVVGAAISSISTEAEPSARQIAMLADAIRAAGVPAVFPENIGNARLMQRLADEAGVRLAPPLYTDALGRPGSAGDSYITMVRANVRTIVTALGG